MIRLRSFAASAGRVRLRSFAASARRVRRAIGIVAATAVFLLIGGTSNAFACPSCFGAEETSMIDGARLGILVMLGITFSVQGGFLGFFLYLRRRARRMADVDLDIEWSELQRGSRTS